MANKVIGKRIKERREALKMSQADLAEKIGYSGKTAVSKIERSVNDVKPKTLVKIAEALHTSVVYLMGLSDDPNYDPWNIPLDAETKLKDDEIDLAMKIRLLPDADVDFITRYVNAKYNDLYQ